MTPPADTPPADTPPQQTRAERRAARSQAKKTPETPPPARDESDTFISEVTEELRKERLYALFRKYGPYAILAIVLFVAAAAYNEYRSASDTSAARAASDRMFAAQQETDRAAAFLSAADTLDGGVATLARFRAAQALYEAGEGDRATALLQDIANDGETPQRYRDLADLKIAMATLETGDPDTLIATFERLARPGAPFFFVALELKAATELRMGDVEAARRSLMSVLETNGVPDRVAARSEALLSAIGGPIEADGGATGETSDATPDGEPDAGAANDDGTEG